MYFHLVWVRSNRYHGSEPLTYASPTRLSTGSIVQVELQRELVLGLVTGLTSEPRFKTKAVSRVYDLPPLPAHLLKLAQWLQLYYPAPIGILTQQLLPASFSEKQLTAILTVKFAKPQLKALPPLTAEQQAELLEKQRTIQSK